MAWIESHQSLLNHPKTIAAQAYLRCDRYKMLGHLHALWWWALDVVDIDGLFPSRCTDAVIAQAAGWPVKQSGAFVDALVNAGFIDEVGGVHRLHDWFDYAGKLVQKRAANKERMRGARATHNTENPAHVQGLPTNQPTNQHNQDNQPEPTPPTNGVAVRPNLFVLIEQMFGPGHVNAGNRDDLLIFEQEHPQECIEHCFAEARKKVPRVTSFKYIRAMAERHRREGCDGNGKRKDSGQSAEADDTAALEARIGRLGRRDVGVGSG